VHLLPSTALISLLDTAIWLQIRQHKCDWLHFRNS
jgi:hypothetical protein